MTRRRDYVPICSSISRSNSSHSGVQFPSSHLSHGSLFTVRISRNSSTKISTRSVNKIHFPFNESVSLIPASVKRNYFPRSTGFNVAFPISFYSFRQRRSSCTGTKRNALPIQSTQRGSSILWTNRYVTVDAREKSFNLTFSTLKAKLLSV